MLNTMKEKLRENANVKQKVAADLRVMLVNHNSYNLL